MSSSKTIGFVLLLTLAWGVSQQAGTASVVFWDTFQTDVVGEGNPAIQTEDGDIGEIWVFENASYYLGVTDTDVPGGGFPGSNRYVYMARGSTTWQGRFQATGWDSADTENEVVQLDFDFWIEDETSLLSIWGLNYLNKYNSFNISTGSVLWGIDTTVASGATWHHGTVLADYAAGTFTTQVDSGAVSGPVDFYVPGVTAVSNFVFYQGALNETNYIDNVQVQILSEEQIPGDTNEDGDVDADDLAVVAANWGETVDPNDYAVGNFNGDTVVDGADAAIQAANWTGPGESNGGTTVPEPSTAFLLISLVGMFLVQRRKR